MKNTEILKNYYAAMERHDWVTKRSLMCDDIKFKGPLMSAESADELIEQIKMMECEVTFEDVEMMEDGDGVMSFFTLKMGAPAEGEFRMAEKVAFSGGKVKSSELIYDARSFPA